MSGGHFEYKQHQITDIADKLESDLVDIQLRGFNSETHQEFLKALKCLRQAAVYSQRIDWLMSGDDGEDSFHERLADDLNEIEVPTEIELINKPHLYSIKFFGDDDVFINGITYYKNVIGGETKELALKELFELLDGAYSHETNINWKNRLENIKETLSKEDYYSSYGNWEIEIEYHFSEK